MATLLAEALYGLGEKELARGIYTRILEDSVTYDMNDRIFALNSIDAINDNSPELKAAVQRLFKEQDPSAKGPASYSVLMTEWLLKKWGIKQ